MFAEVHFHIAESIVYDAGGFTEPMLHGMSQMLQIGPGHFFDPRAVLYVSYSEREPVGASKKPLGAVA